MSRHLRSPAYRQHHWPHTQHLPSLSSCGRCVRICAPFALRLLHLNWVPSCPHRAVPHASTGGCGLVLAIPRRRRGGHAHVLRGPRNAVCCTTFTLVFVDCSHPDHGHVPARHHGGERDHRHLIATGRRHLHRRSLMYLHTSSLIPATRLVKKNLYGMPCRKRLRQRTVHNRNRPASLWQVGDRYGRRRRGEWF